MALLSYLFFLILIALWLFRIPDDQAALRGIVGMATNGVAGALALCAAVALRIRAFRPFGFRAVAPRWLWIGAALGAAAVGVTAVMEQVYFHFITEPNTQADFQAAAQAGPWWLLALVVTGAVLTPLGEEFLFRGVVANALNRYGPWVGVVGSAAIFALAHGLSVILLNAFLVGILTAILFRRTGSVWPGVAVHVVFNGIWLVIYSLV